MAAPPATPSPEAPRKPHVLGAWLAYDPDETLTEFFARRAAALQVGDYAWSEGKIKAHHQKLYERLVDAVGAHQYAWVKVETLAAEFKSNQSTVKRWLATLEKAQLIRRQRQFKTSSRTYVTAYDQRQPQVRGEGQTEQGASNKETEQPDEADAAYNITTTYNDASTDATADAQAANTAAVFFERADAPTYSAHVRSDVKDLPLNTSSDSTGVNGGGKKYTFDITSIDPAIRAIIDVEAINSDHGRQVVVVRPLNELRAVQNYLDGQTNVRDRPGLFVWLNEREFGAQLLAGRVQARSAREGAPTQAREVTQRRRSPRKHPQRRADRPERDCRCIACGHVSAYLGLDDGWCDQCGVRPGDELGKNDDLILDPELWAAVLNQLDIDDVHRNLWLAPTMIAHYAEYPDYIILACPHKVVRDAIRSYYLEHIEAVASTILGRPVQIDDVTVKYMPEVTTAQRAAWKRSEEQDTSTAASEGRDAASTPPSSQWGDELWSTIVAYVNPPAEMFPFFERCSVAHQIPGQVLVIATPNCIVRDELHDTWRSSLQDAAVVVLGHGVTVEFIIDDGEPPPMPRPAVQPVRHLPVVVAHGDAHTMLGDAQVHAAASEGGGSNAGEDAYHHDGDDLGEEACACIWRTLAWRLPIAASERAMWFSHTTRLHQCANGRATVTALTASDVEQLTRYQDMIAHELGLLLGRPITVTIVVAHVATAQEQQEHDHNERVSSGAMNVVRNRGELDDLEHECSSTCERSAPTSEEAANAPHDSEAEYAATWEHVIAHLHLDGKERRTWLDPTTLVELDDQHAVVAVPNVFIERAIEHRYRTNLEVALGVLLHRPMCLQVIITEHGVPRIE